ncbi:lysophospholipase [Polaribacter sp. MSW13]|uniref:Lysophospholipase n=1 Tax=Polaribacter marinus TaxID=2916838 RepID=A0A9X1VQP8_9FLAO|nr:alpha/beta hydrolase [Polaribacter marinus]MCI2230525.1 lysophospholipase [Polaribacter marinus]
MKFKNNLFLLFIIITVFACNKPVENKNSSSTQSKDLIKTENVIFESEGIKLAGTIYSPENPQSALVLVHGSDSVPRMSKMAELLAKNDILVFTYDKRGVGESGGIYAGPEVGTNNISIENLNLLAKDASYAVDLIHKKSEDLPIGLFGASQAGWIIPIVANKNALVKFMVLFSSPTITTLEQLRFQFYTNGRTDFWENYSEKDAREHIKNDPDKYQFKATNPKEFLKTLSIPALWLFGEKDIQIPVKMCIEHINTLKLENKPFEYVLFPSLGHNTNKKEPIEISINWIKQKSFNIKNNETEKLE